jgi:integrase
MARQVSGSVRLVRRKRGPAWYAKYRVDGKQVQKKLGPAWTERSRPPAGHFTRKTAQAALREILADAQRGAPVGASGATFADAATEYLRYVSEVRQIDDKTARITKA